MEFDIATAPGSSLMPRFDHARVEDVMRHGVISCGPEDSLRAVARIMSSYHVHSVVVAFGGDVWGVVSAVDVLEAIGTPRERKSAGEIAATEVITVTAEESLEEAARLMREHKITHVIVTGEGGRPVGVVSTLDIAGTLAWGEA
jgi:CBS domain-containing protein